MDAHPTTTVPTGPRLQLWSYNYDPEPTGIGPVSATLARLLAARGWRVDVVAAHPHYPEPVWGKRLRPYRERRDGIRVLRLPLLVGRDTAAERLRQELSFTAGLCAVTPFTTGGAVPRPDVMVVVSPSFPALLPALANARVRGIPTVLWLNDILPEGAQATGQISEHGLLLRASRWLERTAYRRADRIVVLSPLHRENLLRKGVPEEKVDLIYHPSTHTVPPEAAPRTPSNPPVLVAMGNIGHTQGLAPLVAAFERSADLERLGAEWVITGTGVAGSEVAAELRSGRVRMPGVVPSQELSRILGGATLGVVSQSHSGGEFNLPSKLMNFMARGMPVIAAVSPAGEVARLVERSGAGRVVDSSTPDAFPAAVARMLADPELLARCTAAGREFADANFSSTVFGNSFERTLGKILAGGSS